jgi:PEP-CTERM motif
MDKWIRTFQIIFAAYLAAFAFTEKAEAATTIYQIEVADNNGFTQIRGTLTVPTNMQIGTTSGWFTTILNSPFIELFGLSQAGIVHRAAFALPWVTPSSNFSGGPANSTRLFGAIAGVDTPIPFASYITSNPSFIFSNFSSGGGLTIAYAGIVQERATVDGSVYPTMRLSNATILSITSAVPEPAAWATFLLGFALIGSVMRNRRRTGISFDYTNA